MGVVENRSWDVNKMFNYLQSVWVNSNTFVSVFSENINMRLCKRSGSVNSKRLTNQLPFPKEISETARDQNIITDNWNYAKILSPINCVMTLTISDVSVLMTLSNKTVYMIHVQKSMYPKLYIQKPCKI